MQTVCCDK